MTKKRIFLLILASTIIAAASSFTGCSCNCGNNGNDESFVKGYITVVGNEPFTKLAVKTDDDMIYILQCSKELKEELWKKQGSFYYIIYSSLQKEEGDSTITVEKIIPLTKDDK
ncbi:MAG: hypothetical protein NTX65_14215 [Ignavibacteriales bacterium]|nr:hypothetical protein [Ignavibacteriales bacterium]